MALPVSLGSLAVATRDVVFRLPGLGPGEEAVAPVETLSEKEKAILRLMASGCSNKEIAQALFKSEGTIKNQLSGILAKLDARDRTRAVLRAVELGIIS